MNRDKPDYNINSSRLISLFRGIYGRVARELGVDPSYVSRVARGQRKSELVQTALENEMKRILEKATEDGKKPFPVAPSRDNSWVLDGDHARKQGGHADGHVNGHSTDGHAGNGADGGSDGHGVGGVDWASVRGYSDGDGAHGQDGAKSSRPREVVPVQKKQKHKSPQGKPRKA